MVYSLYTAFRDKEEQMHKLHTEICSLISQHTYLISLQSLQALFASREHRVGRRLARNPTSAMFGVDGETRRSLSLSQQHLAISIYLRTIDILDSAHLEDIEDLVDIVQRPKCTTDVHRAAAEDDLDHGGSLSGHKGKLEFSSAKKSQS